MSLISMPNKVTMVLILQLILVLSNVIESQGWFIDLGPIFGFPPQNPPNPNPNPSPSPSPRPFRPPGLKVRFYVGLCPNKVDIETIIKGKVKEAFDKDPSILPAFLRMQFHDCFVHGCDASILINGASSEKKADANLTVRGYELIDALKAIAEEQCPGIVSCADLIAIVTAEVLRLGGGPAYSVETGRCDGLISNVNDVDLPSPSITAQESINVFRAKDFTPEEMVVLLGCHTVGISHCVFFQDRLYPGPSFDKDMDENLRRALIQTCPQGQTSNNVANLDQNPTSSNKVDNSFFDQLMKKRGLLPVDQALISDSSTSGFVSTFAQSPDQFNAKLASAMLKLQRLDVLTGPQGEIRKTCSRFN
ncbi:peroxidase 57-like [Silene latifolia]|uniref:peroxidase 57-like n=1 Tax=Silene latifolia TaxID=37657 RepID=UPI003D76CB17